MNVSTTPILSTGAPASVRVPADDNLGSSWTASGLTIRPGTARSFAPGVARDTEAAPVSPTSSRFRTCRWHAQHIGMVVAVSAALRQSQCSQWHTLDPAREWRPDSFLSHRRHGQQLLGEDIGWFAGGSGWVIVDGQGKLSPFLLGDTPAEIASLQPHSGRTYHGGTTPISAADYHYEGDGAIAHGSPDDPDLTAPAHRRQSGTTDWRSRYAGSQEPNSQGTAAAFNARPFELGPSPRPFGHHHLYVDQSPAFTLPIG